MKVISFSLYGDSPRYTIGAIRNSELRKEFYPDWEMRVYHNDSVPHHILTKLESNDVALVHAQQDWGVGNAMWRFAPASEEEVAYFISRDCDSRLFERDACAVNEWIASGENFHIIRDHPVGHAWEINAGMWGCKGNSIHNIQRRIGQYLETTPWGSDSAVDQRFLQEIIYSQAITSLCLHDEYFNYEGIGTPIGRHRKLDNFAFVGEPFDENDMQLEPHRQSIIRRYRRDSIIRIYRKFLG